MPDLNKQHKHINWVDLLFLFAITLIKTVQDNNNLKKTPFYWTWFVSVDRPLNRGKKWPRRSLPLISGD
jgi:hypothetical protein